MNEYYTIKTESETYKKKLNTTSLVTENNNKTQQLPNLNDKTNKLDNRMKINSIKKRIQTPGNSTTNNNNNHNNFNVNKFEYLYRE